MVTLRINGGELSDLEYLPTKTEYIEYLQIADTRSSRLFGPIKRYNSRCKQAQDHKKQWRIDLHWMQVTISLLKTL